MARDGKQIRIWYTDGDSEPINSVVKIKENETHYYVEDRYGNTKRVRKKNVKRLDDNGVGVEPLNPPEEDE